MFEFLEPVSIEAIKGDDSYKEGQYGKTASIYTDSAIQWNNADIVLVGVNDRRGKGLPMEIDDASCIRKQFYNLYSWHNDIAIADIGNIKLGKSLQDTYAALQEVVSEIIDAGKTVIILGGSHDCSLAQYYAYSKTKEPIEVTCVDATIDLSLETPFRNDNFLVEMLTEMPNYVKQYNHLGFQSYFVHPKMMDTLEGLRFDCHRVGKVREKMNEYEPYFRNSKMVSIDVAALQHAVMPCNLMSPNGFAGDEACMLTKFAGASNQLSSIGFYNYDSTHDAHQLGAIQIAQMIWYFIDGKNELRKEKNIATQKDFFAEFNTAFADIQIKFFQNKENGKWWMEMPDGSYIACNKKDYLLASQNEIPETWLRHQERTI
jgi:formiminoglutamase